MNLQRHSLVRWIVDRWVPPSEFPVSAPDGMGVGSGAFSADRTVEPAPAWSRIEPRTTHLPDGEYLLAPTVYDFEKVTAVACLFADDPNHTCRNSHGGPLRHGQQCYDTTRAESLRTFAARHPEFADRLGLDQERWWTSEDEL